MVKKCLFTGMLFFSLLLSGCGRQTDSESGAASMPETVAEPSALPETDRYQQASSGHAQSGQKAIEIANRGAAWEESQTAVFSLEESPYHLIGAVEAGVFYSEEVGDRFGANNDMTAERICFLSNEGNRELLLELPGTYYSTFLICGDSLILACNVYGDESGGTTIFRLEQGQPAKVILEQSDFMLPFLYDNETELIAVIRDKTEDGRDSISRLIAYDLSTEEITILAETILSKYGNGERIVCAGGDNDTVYYAVKGVKETQIIKYSRAENKIMGRCTAENNVNFVTGTEDVVIWSETSGQSSLEEAGFIGTLTEEGMQKRCAIPAISASSPVREARIEENRIYFASARMGYLLRTDPEWKLYSYNAEEGPGRAGKRCFVTDVDEKGILVMVAEEDAKIYRVSVQ